MAEFVSGEGIYMATIKDLLSREAIRNTDRLMFLSDGVFAIALTILVLDIKLPASFDAFHFLPSQLLKALEGLQSNIFAYIISFIVIGLSWRAHNLIFRYVKRYDTNIFWLNLLLLLSVAFIPFPTAVLALGINIVSVVFYASCLTIAEGLEAALWIYAIRVRKNRLIDEDLNPHLIMYHSILFLVAPLVFLLSIGLAFIAPGVALLSWILLAVAEEGIGSIFRRRWARQEGKVTSGTPDERKSLDDGQK
jgi:uncharacterized membrane protein